MAVIEPTTIRDAVIKTILESEMFQNLKQERNDIAVYDNIISQGLELGSFFVKSMNASKTPSYRNLYDRQERIAVRYFIPDLEDRESHVLAVSNDLEDMLECILIDGKWFRGRNIEEKVLDDVLHIYVTYPMRVMRPEPEAERMEKLTMNIEGKK